MGKSSACSPVASLRVYMHMYMYQLTRCFSESAAVAAASRVSFISRSCDTVSCAMRPSASAFTRCAAFLAALSSALASCTSLTLPSSSLEMAFEKPRASSTFRVRVRVWVWVWGG